MSETSSSNDSTPSTGLGEGAVDEAAASDPVLRELKLRALAELAAGAGHEINNPLATIVGRAELLARRLTPDASPGQLQECRRELMIIAAQAHRVRDMIGDMMLFARPPKPNPEVLDLCQISRDVAARFLETAESRQIVLTLPESDAPVWINADRAQLAVVISELIRNSLHAVDDDGRVNLSVDRVLVARQSYGRLSVRDDGCGLTELDREHLFDPFYSGRPAGRGLGFGLCKCWRILEQHGGRIDVRPREEGGVVAETLWPSAGND